MRVLVGIDNTKESRIAFDVALRSATSNDHITLCSIVDPPNESDSFAMLEQQAIELETVNSLTSMGHKCLAKKVPFAVLTLSSPHPGKALCSFAEKYKIDHLLVGRRNMSHMKRMLIASTSKYCIEHAPCNVTIVKRAWPVDPVVVPSATSQVTDKRVDFRMATEHAPPSIVYTVRPHKLMDEGVQTDAFMFNPSMPVPCPPLSTVFNETHKLPTTPHVALEEAEWNKYVNEKRMSLKESKDNLELTRLMEDKERQDRVDEIECGRARDKEERRELLEVVKNLEEQERAFRLALTENEEWERSLERANEAREWARYVEEKERQNRMLLSEDEAWELSPERTQAARAWARIMEERERDDRTSLTTEAQEIELYNSKRESQRRLRKVRADEEVERQRRVQKMKLLMDEERELRADASAVDLQRVRMLEEVERQERVKAFNEDRKRKMIEENVQSYKDLQLVKELEEVERARRVSEMGSTRSISRSSAELEVLKEIRNHTQSKMEDDDDDDHVDDDEAKANDDVLGERESLLLEMKKREGVAHLAQRIEAMGGGASV